MLQWQVITVFILIFLVVTALGLWAAQWRSGDLSRLYEWGIGGRRFGTIISWFLLGGDIYTSYTFIAVPALLFAGGAFGFFAVPYVILVYPIMFVVLPRFWTIARHRGYITTADFVAERFESRELALCIALTGILATIAYTALQLYGIEIVLAQMGIPVEMSLILAFLILAIYTYTSGLRAPAMIAVVKDICIWIVILAVFVVFFIRYGGPGAIFSAVPHHLLLLAPEQYSTYATLVLGSAGALLLYPHTVTGLLSCNSREVVRRNSSYLLLYSFMLALITLMGFMARTAHIAPSSIYGVNSIIPTFIASLFPAWMNGFAFAALIMGALVPASIMSIATGNLFTRNIYREYIRPTCGEREEATAAKIASLVVKLGALVFIVLFPTRLAINFQLVGGIWILQTLPAVMIGLYTNWFHRRALIIGWVAGMIIGTWMTASQNFNVAFTLSFLSISVPVYSALTALAVNLFLSWSFTLLYQFLGNAKGEDATSAADYAIQPADAANEEELWERELESSREYAAPRQSLQLIGAAKQPVPMALSPAQLETEEIDDFLSAQGERSDYNGSSSGLSDTFQLEEPTLEPSHSSLENDEGRAADID